MEMRPFSRKEQRTFSNSKKRSIQALLLFLLLPISPLLATTYHHHHYHPPSLSTPSNLHIQTPLPYQPLHQINNQSHRHHHHFSTTTTGPKNDSISIPEGVATTTTNPFLSQHLQFKTDLLKQKLQYKEALRNVSNHASQDRLSGLARFFQTFGFMLTVGRDGLRVHLGPPEWIQPPAAFQDNYNPSVKVSPTTDTAQEENREVTKQESQHGEKKSPPLPIDSFATSTQPTRSAVGGVVNRLLLRDAIIHPRKSIRQEGEHDNVAMINGKPFLLVPLVDEKKNLPFQGVEEERTRPLPIPGTESTTKSPTILSSGKASPLIMSSSSISGQKRGTEGNEGKEKMTSKTVEQTSPSSITTTTPQMTTCRKMTSKQEEVTGVGDMKEEGEWTTMTTSMTSITTEATKL